MRLLTLFAALSLTACSVPAVEPDGPIENELFPHEDGFGEAGQHGQLYLGDDAEVCVACHDPSSTSESGAAGCQACHTDYPHATDFLDGHGPLWHDLEVRSTCASCHGDDLAGGDSGVACDSCHASWPHPAGWRVGVTHAAFLADRDTLDACLGCHLTEPQGEDATTPGCGDCHADYPHADGWSAGDVHGEAYADAGCGTCHGDGSGGGAWAPSCGSCHPAYPHAADWRVEHPVAVDPTGEAPCLLCHEAGDGAGDVPVTCGATCHASAP